MRAEVCLERTRKYSVRLGGSNGRGLHPGGKVRPVLTGLGKSTVFALPLSSWETWYDLNKDQGYLET